MWGGGGGRIKQSFRIFWGVSTFVYEFIFEKHSDTPSFDGMMSLSLHAFRGAEAGEEIGRKVITFYKIKLGAK